MKHVPMRLCALALLCLFAQAAAVEAGAAAAGSADISGGYGWQVLEKVLRIWQPPATAPRHVIVAVRIGSQGEVLYCDARVSSGNPSVDMAACSAVAAAGTFAPPPASLPVEVFLALTGNDGTASAPASGGQMSGPASAPGYAPPVDSAYAPQAGQATAPPRAAGNYADMVMGLISQHVRVPADFKGEATVAVHMRVDAQGRVVAAEIMEATGSTRGVEDAVLQAITKAGNMPPPPSGPQRLVLTFTLRGL